MSVHFHSSLSVPPLAPAPPLLKRTMTPGATFIPALGLLPALSADVQTGVLNITCDKPARGNWSTGFRVNLTAMAAATGCLPGTKAVVVNIAPQTVPTITLVGTAGPVCASEQSVAIQFKVAASALNANLSILAAPSSSSVKCAAFPSVKGELDAQVCGSCMHMHLLLSETYVCLRNVLPGATLPRCGRISACILGRRSSVDVACYAVRYASTQAFKHWLHTLACL